MPQSYEELLTPWLTSSPNSAGDAKGYCPIHEDPATSRSPSASFNFKKKVWNCFGGCDETGTFAQLRKMLETGELPTPEPKAERNNGDFFNSERKPEPLPTAAEVGRWHEAVWDHAPYLYDRGLTAETLRQFKIGWRKGRYTIPVYDQDKLVNVRLYKPHAPPNEKMRNWTGHGSPVRLYPEVQAGEGAVVTEGEWDALLLRQHGLPAVTATHGADTWTDELSLQLAGKRVYVAYDCDDAGRAGAAKVAASLAQQARDVYRADLGLADGEDVTDWFVTHGKTYAEFRRVLAAAPRYGGSHDRLVTGGRFILDGSSTVESIWGDGKKVVWPVNQGVLIVGPQSVGKSTLAQRLLLERLGLGPGHLLNLSVATLPPGGRVLYLAMDRPEQIRYSLRRMVSEEDREVLDERLVVWKGPLPFNILDDKDALADFAQQRGATDIIVDSYKDLVPGISEDRVGSAVNLAMQEVLARGIEWCGLHHQRKATGENKKPDSLNDVYGSIWLTAGCGSVVLLWGKPGASIVELTHLKPAAAPVGPLTVEYDHAEGGSDTVNVRQKLLDAFTGQDEVSEAELAQAVYGEDNRTNRRRIERGMPKWFPEMFTRNPAPKGGPPGISSLWKKVATG